MNSSNIHAFPYWRTFLRSRDVVEALINSLVGRFYKSAPGIVPFQDISGSRPE